MFGVLNRPGPVCNRHFLGFVGSPVYRFKFSIVVRLGVLPCQVFVAMSTDPAHLRRHWRIVLVESHGELESGWLGDGRCLAGCV